MTATDHDLTATGGPRGPVAVNSCPVAVKLGSWGVSGELLDNLF